MLDSLVFEIGQNFSLFKKAAAYSIKNKIAPHQITWKTECTDNLDLFGQGNSNSLFETSSNSLDVRADYKKLAENVACAQESDKWHILYDLLFRLKFISPHTLEFFGDPVLQKALHYQKEVTREIHKLHAFVRFKKVGLEPNESYIAWFEPSHFVIEKGTPFFARRFGDRPWSIFTPYQSAHFIEGKLTFGPGIRKEEFSAIDQYDILWESYYRSIYNPARLNLKAMKNEMAVKYWKNMPEVTHLQRLIAETPNRLQKMNDKALKNLNIDESWTLEQVYLDSLNCTACPIHEKATQTVFGKGPAVAPLMIVGEQPGDEEDLAGVPFVGPSGKMLEQWLSNFGMQTEQIYITNSVKHFKWEPHASGRRLHKKASTSEIGMCRPWLEAEIKRVKPRVLLAMGVTAALSTLGKLVKLQEVRGKAHWSDTYNCWIIPTWHPAAILRASSEIESESRTQQVLQDIQLAVSKIEEN